MVGLGIRIIPRHWTIHSTYLPSTIFFEKGGKVTLLVLTFFFSCSFFCFPLLYFSNLVYFANLLTLVITCIYYYFCLIWPLAMPPVYDSSLISFWRDGMGLCIRYYWWAARTSLLICTILYRIHISCHLVEYSLWIEVKLGDRVFLMFCGGRGRGSRSLFGCIDVVAIDSP